MRIFTRILKVFLVIIFVLSIVLNIILGASSTTFTLYTNKKKAITEMYYSSAIALTNSKAITIKSTTPYSLEEGHTSKDEISCKVIFKDDSESYECRMVSKLYNKDSSLVRTSYFPGDGYKYTAENNTYTKTKYSNDNLYSYFSALTSGANINLYRLVYDSETAESYSSKIKKGLFFDLNTFSLNKKLSLNCNESATSKNTIKYRFDSHDRLEYLKDTNQKSTLSINYKYSKLSIPDLIGYTEM